MGESSTREAFRMTHVEVEGWSNDPDEWVETPPLRVFKRLVDRDPDLMYRVQLGDLWNLIEQAFEEV